MEVKLKLNVDLSGALEPNKPTKDVNKTSKPKKMSIEQLAEGLPSPSQAKALALKNAPRVQFSFTNFPEPIKEAFGNEAEKRGMNKKEFLFYCLRAGGMDIPPYEEIDGRRR